MLTHLGHLDAARTELSRVLAIDPKLTIAGYRDSFILRHRKFWKS